MATRGRAGRNACSGLVAFGQNVGADEAQRTTQGSVPGSEILVTERAGPVGEESVEATSATHFSRFPCTFQPTVHGVGAPDASPIARETRDRSPLRQNGLSITEEAF